MKKALGAIALFLFSAAVFSHFRVLPNAKKDSTKVLANGYSFMHQTSKVPLATQTLAFSKAHAEPDVETERWHLTTAGNMWRVAVVGGITGELLSLGGPGRDFTRGIMHDAFVSAAIVAGAGVTFCFVNGIVRTVKRKRDKATS